MTAVEQIKSEFYSYVEPYIGFSEESKWTISEEDFEKLIEKAKEMEKEQIINAALYGFRQDSDGDDWQGDNYNAEKYYNTNFKLK